MSWDGLEKKILSDSPNFDKHEKTLAPNQNSTSAVWTFEEDALQNRCCAERGGLMLCLLRNCVSGATAAALTLHMHLHKRRWSPIHNLCCVLYTKTRDFYTYNIYSASNTHKRHLRKSLLLQPQPPVGQSGQIPHTNQSSTRKYR